MQALLLFHLRVGVRIAVRSFVPLFSAIIAIVMLHMYPAALVTGLARSAYSPNPALSQAGPFAVLAFVLAAWGASWLSHGLNGWLRHLPANGVANRRGLTIGLAVVQMPLALSLVILAIVAHTQGLSLGRPAVRWVLVLGAAALAATPAQRRWIAFPLSVAAGVLALRRDWTLMLLAATLLGVADLIAGRIREGRSRKAWRAAGSLIDIRIAWRALGWRVFPAYLWGLMVLGASALFIGNNELTGALAHGAARFGCAMACLLYISSIAEKLAIRRPVWPLARSFPRSSAQRVATDAIFLGLHVLPLVLLTAVRDMRAALSVLSVLPLLCLRASSWMRRIQGRRTGAGAYLAEGSLTAALLALLPVTGPVSLVCAIPVFFSARQTDRCQKVTRWAELRHVSAGDTLSWEER